MPWGLFALNNRGIFRAFNFLVVPGPAVTKKEEGTIRLCCLGGFQGHHRLLGLNSSLSSLAPWCEKLKALVESFPASLPIRSTIRFLSKPPVIAKWKPRFACIYWRQYIYFGWMESLVRWMIKMTWRAACCSFVPCGIQDTVYYSIYHLMVWPSIYSNTLPLEFELYVGVDSILLIPVSPGLHWGAATE